MDKNHNRIPFFYSFIQSAVLQKVLNSSTRDFGSIQLILHLNTVVFLRQIKRTMYRHLFMYGNVTIAHGSIRIENGLKSVSPCHCHDIRVRLLLHSWHVWMDRQRCDEMKPSS